MELQFVGFDGMLSYVGGWGVRVSFLILVKGFLIEGGFDVWIRRWRDGVYFGRVGYIRLGV